MGMTGVGKSTFINSLTNDADIRVGKGLRSCTKEIQPAHLHHVTPDGKRYDVYLVDTPGFDDTEMSDTDVLLTFVDWLGLQYKNDLKLSGLIYLHRITDNRMTGTATRNLTMMRKLCGDENMKNVLLVTTRWEMMEYERCVEVETEYLLGPGGFWHGMVSQGAGHARYNGTLDAARQIIDRIVVQSPVFLRIQQELSEGKDVRDTAAGQALITELEKQALKRERELAQIKEDMLKASENAERNAELLEEQRRISEDLMKKMQQDQESMQKMLEADRATMQQRIMELQSALGKKRKWWQICVIQ
ncbi:P-loop containing nucleoside triphosphate hydrolase protein [Terfezia claveryi]|nr:P-loop containing nucleoside triphosphate hydrolase protein [Terfezia claveryi]